LDTQNSFTNHKYAQMHRRSQIRRLLKIQITNPQYANCDESQTINVYYIIIFDQVHRTTNVISKAVKEKKYCCEVFLDVAQAFDNVPQGNVFGRIFYLLYSDNIPTNNLSMTDVC